MITFEVHGVPVPQGSMKAFVPRGGRRPIVTSDNVKTKPWKQEVAATALAHRPPEPWTGPVRVHLEFRFVRPKSVKPEKRPFPDVKPDKDKLERAILDALTGIFYVDDAQVCDGSCRKVYADAPGVTISVERITA